MFTAFLTNPAGCGTASTPALNYWLGQHGVGRGGETHVLLRRRAVRRRVAGAAARAIGAVLAFRRPTLLRRVPDLGVPLSLAVYSWAGEKFAWLVLHPLLPLVAARRRRACRRSGRRAADAAARPGSRPRRSRCSTSRSPRGGSTSTTAPTRASCSSPPSPRREVKDVATRCWRQAEGAAGTAADRHGRLRRGRDVPVRVVLPRPHRRLPRPPAADAPPPDYRRADHDRGGRTPGWPTRWAATRPAVPVPRLVGARLREAVDPGNLVRSLDHAAQAVEPDRRDARVALRPEGA